MKTCIIAILLFCAVCGATPADPWNAGQRNEILTGAEQALNAYVFPDRVPAIRAAIESHRAELTRISDPKTFADSTSRVIYGASHDQHLQVMFSDRALPSVPKRPMQDREGILREERLADFGYISSARLDGNIGYLRIDWFSPSVESAKMLDAAMTLVSHTNALVIDLRSNDGGSPTSVDYLMGYFVPAHTQLTGFVMRTDGKLVPKLQYAAAVSGPPYVHKALYLLTSGDTFSAAEQFAYDLQSLHRASVVGEASGGGANIGGPMRLSSHFMLFVPHGFARSPYTGTNWDGVGVRPNSPVKSTKALLQAYTEALKSTQDESNEELKQARENPAAALRKIFFPRT